MHERFYQTITTAIIKGQQIQHQHSTPCMIYYTLPLSLMFLHIITRKNIIFKFWDHSYRTNSYISLSTIKQTIEFNHEINLN